MSATEPVTKAITEVEDITIDWSTRGLGTDTITGSVWSVSPSDLIINSPAPTNTTTTTTVWLSGGTAGNQYLVTNIITTAGGRTLSETFIVDCVAQRLIGQ